MFYLLRGFASFFARWLSGFGSGLRFEHLEEAVN